MKKVSLTILIILTSTFVISFEKDYMIVEYNQTNWYQNNIVEKITDLGNYFYDFKLIDSKKTFYLTNHYDFEEEMSYDADVFLRITNNSTDSVNIYYEINGENTYKKVNVKYSSDWVEEFSVNLLEEISLKRLKFDDKWDLLQLTFYTGVDEYPIKRNNTIAFISDRYKGNREVFYYDLKDNKINKIPLELSSEYFPDISSDGNYFVFQTTLFGNWDIVVYDKIKNDFIKITEDTYGYSPYFKDNNTIIYSEDIKNIKKHNRIVEYNLSKEEKRVISDDTKYLKYRPSLYKDSLMYYGINADTAEVKIFTQKEETQSLFDLTRNQMDSWSDNSDKVVFSYNLNSSYDIFYLFENNLLNLTKDIDSDSYYPTFSDDGKFVFFSLYYKNKEPDIFIKKIF
jgi:TolB protein